MAVCTAKVWLNGEFLGEKVSTVIATGLGYRAARLDTLPVLEQPRIMAWEV